jgi:hypothetical protein
MHQNATGRKLLPGCQRFFLAAGNNSLIIKKSVIAWQSQRCCPHVDTCDAFFETTAELLPNVNAYRVAAWR